MAGLVVTVLLSTISSYKFIIFSEDFLSTYPSPSFTILATSVSSLSGFETTFFVFALEVRENLSAVVRFTQKFTIYLKKI